MLGVEQQGLRTLPSMLLAGGLVALFFGIFSFGLIEIRRRETKSWGDIPSEDVSRSAQLKRTLFRAERSRIDVYFSAGLLTVGVVCLILSLVTKVA